MNLKLEISPSLREADVIYLEVTDHFACLKKENSATPIVSVSLISKNEDFTTSRSEFSGGFWITVTSFCIWIKLPNKNNSAWYFNSDFRGKIVLS